jgi:predicted LPLAT superfamily acyltransferase
LHLGRPVARSLLYPITLYFVATSSSSRAASRAFLQRALRRRATLADVFRHHHCFAATILDRVFLLSGQTDRFKVQIFNGNFVADKVRAREGCILLGSHLGSFEILRALGVREKRFPIKVLMDVRQNPTITRHIHSLGSDIAETVIHAGDLASLVRVKEAIEQGFLVGILGDRIQRNEKQVHCNFFDSPAGFSTNPAKFAIAMDTPVVLFFGLYRGANRYDIHFELLRGGGDVLKGDRQTVVSEVTCRYAQRLEYYARQAPYNWFNFYDYWVDDGSAPRTGAGNDLGCHDSSR